MRTQPTEPLRNPGRFSALVHNSCGDDLPVGRLPERADLGIEPNQPFSRVEYDTAIRVESELGVTLERSANSIVDWVDPNTGTTYDAMLSGIPTSSFDIQWSLGNIQNQIHVHVVKADVVPIDVTSITSSQYSVILAWVDSPANLSAAQRSQVVFVGTPSG